MAGDLTRDTDRAIEEGRSLLRDNRAGGRHRRVRERPIGRGSAELRQKNLMTRIKRAQMMRLEAGRLSDPTGALRYPPRPSDMTGWADKAPPPGEPRR